MPSLRVSVWYVQAFWQKYKKLLLAGVGLGIILVWLFPRAIQYIPRARSARYIGRVGLFVWSDLPLDIQQKVSAGLTALDESGEVVPVLAERWSVEEDGTVFRFLIKENLRWQDGKPFTPEDVQYNFGDVMTVATNNEVVFRLKDPYAPFPSVVSQPLFRHIETQRLGLWQQTQIIGLGEYRVVSVKYTNGFVSQLTLENDRERLTYRFYSSEQDAVVAFRHGDIDVLEHMPTIEALLPDERRRYRLTEAVNLRQYVALYFNTADPQLSREVRQALAYATEKPGPDSPKLRALSPISPLSWAYNATDEVNAFVQDLPHAVELYMSVNPGQPLALTLDAPLALLSDAQAIANQWQHLGDLAQQQCERTKKANDPSCERFQIHVTARVITDLQDIQAALFAREVPPDPDQYSWWHSTQSTNITRYQNPRVDKLLEDARKETDEQKRKVLYFEFQRYLVEDVPAMFLWYVNEYHVERR